MMCHNLHAVMDMPRGARACIHPISDADYQQNTVCQGLTHAVAHMLAPTPSHLNSVQQIAPPICFLSITMQLLRWYIATGRARAMQEKLECAWRMHMWRRPYGRSFEVRRRL